MQYITTGCLERQFDKILLKCDIAIGFEKTRQYQAVDHHEIKKALLLDSANQKEFNIPVNAG
jgi:hypothetical protein